MTKETFDSEYEHFTRIAAKKRLPTKFPRNTIIVQGGARYITKHIPIGQFIRSPHHGTARLITAI